MREGHAVNDVLVVVQVILVKYIWGVDNFETLAFSLDAVTGQHYTLIVFNDL